MFLYVLFEFIFQPNDNPQSKLKLKSFMQLQKMKAIQPHWAARGSVITTSNMLHSQTLINPTEI